MDYETLLTLIDKEGIKFLELKVPDLSGKLRHLSLPASHLPRDVFEHGVGFDGSSYGLARVSSSDLVLIPELDTCFRDPSRDVPTISCFASIRNTDIERTPFDDDPRLMAKKAEDLLKKELNAVSLWAPEYEFYIFKNFALNLSPLNPFLRIEPLEDIKTGAYHADTPFDLATDFRNEACLRLDDLKIPVKYHHHEGGGMGQQEIETYFQGLLATCDQALLIKYVLKNLAKEAGLFLTFMPKPIPQAAGNGWHVHLFLKAGERNLFYDPQGIYANLSNLALNFLAGILRHARSLCALTNPSTNSYKRLLSGFEAPVSITFGKANRSSACRIPTYIQPEEARFEYRPPDLSCNPYIALVGILLAGLDGVRKEVNPVQGGFGPWEGGAISEAGKKKMGNLPTSLEEALQALENDWDYLQEDKIISRPFLEKWVKEKREEAAKIAEYVNIREYELYF